jgi:hypothetical protein
VEQAEIQIMGIQEPPVTILFLALLRLLVAVAA